MICCCHLTALLLILGGLPFIGAAFLVLRYKILQKDNTNT